VPLRLAGEDAECEKKPSRLIAVVGVKAWKGYVRYSRVKPLKSRYSERILAAVSTVKPRRILSIFVVGRRDIASLIDIMVSACLRPASEESSPLSSLV